MKKETQAPDFCFVLIPQTKKFLNLWDGAIKPAIERNNMEPLSCGNIKPNYGNFMGSVRERIINADMIIAVITDQDPQVMYQLGLAHSAKKKIILMLDNNSAIPEDFLNAGVFVYDPEDLPAAREELTQLAPSARQTQKSDDFFPELHIRKKEDVEEYQYLKQTRKTLTVKVVPKNCSIFFNNRFLGKSPQTIIVNPDAERNVLSISAAAHFEYYKVLTAEDIADGLPEIKMEPRDKEKYSERVTSWLMRRREDPDNPVLSRAIAGFFLDKDDVKTARVEAEFCISKAPGWFGGYNDLGIVENETGNHEKAKFYFESVTILNPDDFLGYYNIACSESRAGNYSAALETLQKITDSPKLSESYRQIYFRIKKHIAAGDSAFDPLRNHPEYKDKFNQILKKFDQIVFGPEPSLISEPSSDVKLNKEINPLPYTLKQLQIENFQCIQKAAIEQIPVDCPWIFITGENGDGKTSLLQAIATGLHDVNETVRFAEDKDCKIDTEIQQNGVSCVRHCFWENDHWYMVNPLKNRENQKPAKNLSAYGPTRIYILSEEAQEKGIKHINPIDNLLLQRITLLNIHLWLKEQKLETDTKKGDEHFKFKKRIQNVKSLLVDLMPHVSEIELKGKEIFYTENGHKVQWHHLSAGHKSIVAMIGDLLIRLFESQPEKFDTKELEGIVLIDELDTHLHPKWQLKFPALLSRAFPKVQFIVSTHSVIPLMGAPEGSIFLKVSRDITKGTKVDKIDIDIANLLPNSILTSPLFDLESILSGQNKDFSELWTEDSFKEIERQKERDKHLASYKEKEIQIPKEFFDPEVDKK